MQSSKGETARRVGGGALRAAQFYMHRQRKLKAADKRQAKRAEGGVGLNLCVPCLSSETPEDTLREEWHRSLTAWLSSVRLSKPAHWTRTAKRMLDKMRALKDDAAVRASTSGRNQHRKLLHLPCPMLQHHSVAFAKRGYRNEKSKQLQRQRQKRKRRHGVRRRRKGDRQGRPKGGKEEKATVSNRCQEKEE